MLRYATPEYVLAALSVLKVYHWISKRYNRRLFLRSLPCHSFAWLYLFLLYLYVRALNYTLNYLYPHSATLNPVLVEAAVNESFALQNDTCAFEDWRKDASLEEYELLRWMSVSSPYWVMATFIVCLYHIARHAMEMHRTSGGNGMRFVLHDKTIQVLLLPTVYGLMSLNGVIFMWGIILNEETTMQSLRSWQSRKKYYTEMYESAFFIADIYESFALLVLGQVVMKVLQRKVRHTIDDHLPSGALGSTISAGKLMKEMQELTTFGIKFFCWTCGLQALYQLLLTTMGYYGIFEEFFGLPDRNANKAPGLFHTKGVENKSRYFFLGAGFVASFAAIGNVVKVETAFHHQLREFQPFWKFWGTKIIVSIAFLQSMVLWVLPPFSWWSQVRQNLFYASLLCLECFLVSLLHLKAWGHDQIWYEGINCSESCSEGSAGSGSEDQAETLTGELEDDPEDSSRSPFSSPVTRAPSKGAEP